MREMKKILVVSRGTDMCRSAVKFGIDMARHYDAELHILEVFHDPFNLDGWNLAVPTASFHEEFEAMVNSVRQEIEKIVQEEKADGLDIKKYFKEGEPVEEILNAVEKENFDLIILQSHEEGRLEHFLFGKTNDAIVRKMPTSVLFVKTDWNCDEDGE